LPKRAVLRGKKAIVLHTHTRARTHTHTHAPAEAYSVRAFLLAEAVSPLSASAEAAALPLKYDAGSLDSSLLAAKTGLSCCVHRMNVVYTKRRR